MFILSFTLDQVHNVNSKFALTDMDMQQQQQFLEFALSIFFNSMQIYWHA